MAISLFCWLKTRSRGACGGPESNSATAPGMASERPMLIWPSETLNLEPWRTRFSIICRTFTRGKCGSRCSRGMTRSGSLPARAALANSSSGMACSMENSPTAVRSISARCAPQPSFSPISCAREDVGARRTLDHEASEGAFQVRQTIFKEFDVHGFQLDDLFLAGQFVSGPAVNFFGGKCGRHLLEASNTLGGKALEHAGIESGAGVRALRFAIRVVRVGGEAEAEAGGVALSPAGIEARQPGRAPEEQNQNACREGIKRAQMADLAETGKMPDGIDYVVRRLAPGLVDDQSAIEGRGLRLARHEF